MKLMNIAEWEHAARRVLSPMAEAYYCGGARDEITLRANRAAWEQMYLHYKVLVDVSHRSAATRILGQSIELPVITAPTAFHRLAHDHGEYASAAGTGNSGTIFVASTLSTVSMEAIAQSATGPLWFQLYVYKDRGITRTLIKRAEASGYQALVLTVDAAEIGTRERDARHAFHLPEGMTIANLDGLAPSTMSNSTHGSALSAYVRAQLDPSLTWDDVDWLSAQTNLPIVIKGLVRSDDAKRAVDSGARAIVVSNHGGRQLDTAPPTALVLPRIVDAVGDQCEVIVDGGIRRGTDIIKALACGARAVMIGRPILWGLAVNGQHGVEGVLECLKQELLEGMALCGCPDIKSISKALLDQSSSG